MSQARISLEAVHHVAKLAALKLTSEEEARMRGELDAILGHMDELAELDVSAVKATSHAMAIATALRPDRVEPSLPRGEILAAAPAQAAFGFAVPKVMDGDAEP
jgi:aspartyl-tRNA(Asn)/glutamyl-tRNA(Gln) amidotransferase subunit C